MFRCTQRLAWVFTMDMFMFHSLVHGRKGILAVWTSIFGTCQSVPIQSTTFGNSFRQASHSATSVGGTTTIVASTFPTALDSFLFISSSITACRSVLKKAYSYCVYVCGILYAGSAGSQSALGYRPPPARILRPSAGLIASNFRA